ncbi:sulfite exporter TauE/SafE family protein [Aliarcobacter butzleri]|uniref:Probable membrane transporter protein n=1 Tax=Aliarcobacter butzleri TaxID=28197 RepID=A0AAP4PZS5_9BACT|nr:sulfite exporter TauE/SafE family protein [Aliarcobacter butzleri]MDN5052564.1 sulfite exporter TauE/SafE family protein [Aliarcobacter butzleri]MDN5075162.1 sulfite exporter TauE/SafE family protein [Aliarcobacter butzleri]MDN5116814.1 sulfite exporter TauE/SafE family protein [Aliarcobacter butzleri]MDN5132806.1 sulfite exporter TauE/SafE family protein [Aliarcobacter butzleri]NUW27091.1 sulfite exporter TauE/SafE family protein [Aliarcobacter butzleri]
MLELGLGVITFLTSVIAAVVGIGGGMMLIAIIPSFLPVNALIPVHGLTQVSSNLSRAIFGYKDVQYEVVPKFLIGSILGIAFFVGILNFISLEYVPLFIGVYILLSLWSQKFNEKIKRYENYYLAGFFQTGLSMVVGATGPLTMTLLFKDYNDKDKVVATGAALMSITHFLKVVVFIYFGFVFFDYIWIIISMIIGAVVGSFVGTKLRNIIDGKRFTIILKVLLTILALNLIIGILLKSF